MQRALIPKLYDNKPWHDAMDGPVRKEEGYELVHSFWTGNGIVLGCAKIYILIQERQLSNVEISVCMPFAECINLVAEVKDVGGFTVGNVTFLRHSFNLNSIHFQDVLKT